MKISDADGNELPPGEMGEVWMRSATGERRPTATSAPRRATLDGGWESLGDMGWFDEDGYLYLGDRSADMILVGGANIYPAEVEAALDEHPAVRSACVIGLPDDDLGNRSTRSSRPTPTPWSRTSCGRSSASGSCATRCRARSSSSTSRSATTPARCAAAPCRAARVPQT